jgi:hypothetical protein
MIKRLSILMLCMVAGCMTHAPVIPARYQIGIPSADAATNEPIAGQVYLGRVYKSYTIPIVAHTNNTDIDPADPAYTDVQPTAGPPGEPMLISPWTAGATTPGVSGTASSSMTPASGQTWCGRLLMITA